MDRIKPIYAQKAKLVSCLRLKNDAVELSYARLATLCGHHENTVQPAIASERTKEYNVAHAIFTALNFVLHNEHAREDHVFYLTDEGKFEKDEALKDCGVFYKFADVLQESRIELRKLADETQVEMSVMESIRVGRPVDARVLRQVFEAINFSRSKLNLDPCPENYLVK